MGYNNANDTMKKKNNELQSRREFFKKAAKGALPILGAVLLASSPIISKASEECLTYCNHCNSNCTNGCRTGCHRGCGNDCFIACKSSSSSHGGPACATCMYACMGCKGGCNGTCMSSCIKSNYTVS